jgi:hypothetical protein
MDADELRRRVEELRLDLLRSRSELEAKIDRQCAELERAMKRRFEKERSRAELNLWTVVTMLAIALVSAAVVMNAVRQFR